MIFEGGKISVFENCSQCTALLQHRIDVLQSSPEFSLRPGHSKRRLPSDAFAHATFAFFYGQAMQINWSSLLSSPHVANRPQLIPVCSIISGNRLGDSERLE